MVADKFSPHSVGGRIISLREEQGMSQGQLAAALDISTSALRNLEHNDSQPRLANLEKLSDIFKVPIDYIVRGVIPDGEGGLDIFREMGLNDLSVAYMKEQIELGKTCGGLSEYITTLNSLVSGGFLNLVWTLNRLNSELAAVDKKLGDALNGKPETDDIVKVMQWSEEVEPLREERDLLKLRYLRGVERVFDRLIVKMEEEDD